MHRNYARKNVRPSKSVTSVSGEPGKAKSPVKGRAHRTIRSKSTGRSDGRAKESIKRSGPLSAKSIGKNDGISKRTGGERGAGKQMGKATGSFRQVGKTRGSTKQPGMGRGGGKGGGNSGARGGSKGRR